MDFTVENGYPSGFVGNVPQVDMADTNNMFSPSNGYPSGFVDVERKRQVDDRIKLAKEIVAPSYFGESGIDKALQIPKSERPQFLEQLQQEAFRVSKDNEDRGILGGMWEAFKYARNQSDAAIRQFVSPSTLTFGLIDDISDEDWLFVEDINAIKSGSTVPENRGLIQHGLEGAASFVPDMAAAAALAGFGGPKASGAYIAARVSPGLENEMNRIGVSSEIRKPLAVAGSIPIAMLENIGLGTVLRPLKTPLVKSIQATVANTVKKNIGKIGENAVARAVGNYGMDYSTNMVQEIGQEIVESSTVTLGQALEEGGLDSQGVQEAQRRYYNGMVGLMDAALPMAFLVGGGRIAERLPNLPADLRYFANQKQDQLERIFNENPDEVKAIIESDGVPSRKQIEDIGITGKTSQQDRQDIKDDLAGTADANDFDFSFASRNKRFAQENFDPAGQEIGNMSEEETALIQGWVDARNDPNFGQEQDGDYYDNDPDVYDQENFDPSQPAEMYGANPDEVALMEEWASRNAEEEYSPDTNFDQPDIEEDFDIDFNPSEMEQQTEDDFERYRLQRVDDLSKLKASEVNQLFKEYEIELPKGEKTRANKIDSVAEVEAKLFRAADRTGLEVEELKQIVKDRSLSRKRRWQIPSVRYDLWMWKRLLSETASTTSTNRNREIVFTRFSRSRKMQRRRCKRQF